MALGWLAGPKRGRVNPVAPAVVMLAGLVWLAMGHAWVGAGIAVGAVLAYINGLLLSRRIDFAATSGNAATALMVMQVGLLITMTIIGAATIVLIQLSLSMAVASAAGFGVAQMAILGAFYWLHGRGAVPSEREAS
jgi:prepilin signal peptidase PulO-like enzyme (type II secretory pathway)